MNQPKPVIIIGGGLAGCEAAWQLARRGVPVTLYEMKPGKFSPASKSAALAELVCSNSLRSNSIENAVGLLKEELRQLNSLIMEAADATAVPAGRALAVDRTLFSRHIEERLASSELITTVRQEITAIPADNVAIIATGPLTSSALAQSIAALTGGEYLYFYDALSPIIDAESIDYSKVFKASRYEDGEGDYLNCPMTEEEYFHFWNELVKARETPLKDFEDKKCFEGCLPIEVLARRGQKTLLFGPMKPVGLRDPRTGQQPYAVIQLRSENKQETLYNIVGFQTKLTRPEQERIFGLIPGLKNAEFARYGAIHRNTFINSPALLQETLQLRSNNSIFFAGQITGVEGYIESAAMGLAAGIFVQRYLAEQPIIAPPPTTAIGALLHHITNADTKVFQPMNVTFGLFPPLARKLPKRERGRHYAQRSLENLTKWQEEVFKVENRRPEGGR